LAPSSRQTLLDLVNMFGGVSRLFSLASRVRKQ
jgi:hypothetical protein